MLAVNAGRVGLVVIASLAITGCSGSTRKLIDADARDSATTALDSADGSSDRRDAANAAPDAVAVDAAAEAGHAAPETPIVARDSASPESTVASGDAGQERDAPWKDAATEAVERDGAGNSSSEAAVPNRDTHGANSDASASMTVSPTDTQPYYSTVFTVTNVSSRSSGTITVRIAGAEASHFELSGNTCTQTLAPGGQCQITVYLRELACLGMYTASLIIVAEGFPGEEFTAKVTGICV